MAVEGAIAEAARRVLPVTWDALSRDTNRFGDALLQSIVDTVKDTLFGNVVTAQAEDQYPLRVIQYAGKMVALELIPAGIDFWMNELLQESASGVAEQHTFVDRADKLRQQGERLGWEITRDSNDIYALLGRRPNRRVPVMGISISADDVLLTPNPREFPAPFRQGTGAQRLT